MTYVLIRPTKLLSDLKDAQIEYIMPFITSKRLTNLELILDPTCITLP